MFTGIIEELGKIEALLRSRDGFELTVGTKAISDLKEGDSISVNGTCLTVKEKLRKGFKADVVKETISRSSLKYLKVGELVNLERAMPSNGRFDGHIVQGHVDISAIITNIVTSGHTKEIEIRVPEGFARYVSEKGSISIDGVSLTISSVSEDYFKVSIIPQTIMRTNLVFKKIGDHVNIEFDVLAKYLEKLVRGDSMKNIMNIIRTPIDENFLKRAGFLS